VYDTLNQRNTVFAFKERKDRLDFQVVGDDFLADLQREVGRIEGEGNTIRQAHAMNSDDALALCRSGTDVGYIDSVWLPLP
jgi:hypothetical protein